MTAQEEIDDLEIEYIANDMKLRWDRKGSKRKSPKRVSERKLKGLLPMSIQRDSFREYEKELELVLQETAIKSKVEEEATATILLSTNETKKDKEVASTPVELFEEENEKPARLIEDPHIKIMHSLDPEGT